MPNNLAKERSPYLQQHKDNPVNWYAWGEKAFAEAKKENKPLLVSIGYSSCHWCHVMAHEDFEDEEVAKVMNEHLISIKVDKEEYPDMDGFYMEFMQQLTGQGGWPLNVFVNHNKVPFYAVTYLPKKDFIELITKIADTYKEEVREQTLHLPFSLEQLAPSKAKKLVRGATPGLLSHPGPQFPQAALLLYALRKGVSIEAILRDMLTKGLFDHIEGGWFRYTVDQEWKIPHFEKMLYDQATLLLLCAQAYQQDQNKLYAHAIQKTVAWLTTHMRLSTGMYGSATDADTPDGEGFYYTIAPSKEKAQVQLFQLTSCGIHEGRPLPWLDFAFYQNNTETSEAIIKKYQEERKKLAKPGLDEKSVMSWNSFLCYALLRCAAALKDDSIKDKAIELFDSLTKYHVGERIHHVVYGTEPLENQEYLEDYAAYLLVLAELAQEKPVFRERANQLVASLKEKFVQDNQLFTTTFRPFESIHLWQDSPFPSGGAMLLYALFALDAPETKEFVKLTSGITEVAVHSATFFGFWLAVLTQYYEKT